jgi:hypothetical protein
MGMPENAWKRRHAIQIAAQLPEDPADALAVLDLAKALVESFLVEAQPTRVLAPRPAGEVRAFPASIISR